LGREGRGKRKILDFAEKKNNCSLGGPAGQESKPQQPAKWLMGNRGEAPGSPQNTENPKIEDRVRRKTSVTWGENGERMNPRPQSQLFLGGERDPPSQREKNDTPGGTRASAGPRARQRIIRVKGSSQVVPNPLEKGGVFHGKGKSQEKST